MLPVFIKEKATLIVFLLGVAATIGFGSWCYDKGKKVERSEWQSKENEELIAKNELLAQNQLELQRLQVEKAEAERKLTLALSQIGTQVTEDINKNDEDTERTIAELLANAELMQKHLRMSEANAATSQLASTTLRSYAAGQARLSEQALRFLGQEAGRANRTAIIAEGCQATLKETYEAVDAYNRKYFGSDVKL